jgi:hypothetical protein
MKEETYIIKTVPLIGPTLSELKRERILLPETPCDKCRLYTHEYCQEREIACKDFRYFIDKGKVRIKWRDPDTETFFQINPKLKRHEMAQELMIVGEKETGAVDNFYKERDLIERLRIRSLEEIDNYFNNKTSAEKAKIACVVYSLVLKADTVQKGREI